jgi:hypothetical protein
LTSDGIDWILVDIECDKCGEVRARQEFHKQVIARAFRRVYRGIFDLAGEKGKKGITCKQCLKSRKCDKQFVLESIQKKRLMARVEMKISVKNRDLTSDFQTFAADCFLDGSTHELKHFSNHLWNQIAEEFPDLEETDEASSAETSGDDVMIITG